MQQRSLPDYPMPKLAYSPLLETWLVASEDVPGGVGEPCVPPLAPAGTNALFALTGKRLRARPLLLKSDNGTVSFPVSTKLFDERENPCYTGRLR